MRGARPSGSGKAWSRRSVASGRGRSSSTARRSAAAWSAACRSCSSPPAGRSWSRASPEASLGVEKPCTCVSARWAAVAGLPNATPLDQYKVSRACLGLMRSAAHSGAAAATAAGPAEWGRTERRPSCAGATTRNEDPSRGAWPAQGWRACPARFESCSARLSGS